MRLPPDYHECDNCGGIFPEHELKFVDTEERKQIDTANVQWRNDDHEMWCQPCRNILEYESYFDSVSELLNRLDFVTWDRYTEWTDEETGETWRVFYGWIDREDSHEDFVTVKVNMSQKAVVGSMTSSSKYSEQIHESLGFDLDDHNDCRRVENLDADVNCIELESDQDGA